MHHLRAVFRDAAAFILTAHHEAGDVLEEDQRHPPLGAELDKVCGLERGLGEQHTVVRHNADEVAVQPGESGDQCWTIPSLEFVKAGTVHQPRNDLAWVVLATEVGPDDPAQFPRVVARVFW